MEKEYSYLKSYCELVIMSHEVSLDYITSMLNSQPTRFFNKGDEYHTQSGQLKKRPVSIWNIQSPETILAEEDISHHIDFFRKELFNKISILEELKRNQQISFVFVIHIETEDLRIYFDINKTELEFIQSISNGLRFSLFTNKQIKMED